MDAQEDGERRFSLGAAIFSWRIQGPLVDSREGIRLSRLHLGRRVGQKGT